MSYKFKATTTITKSYDWTLKTMFEFVPSQMSQTKSKSYNMFDYITIVTVLIRIWRWSY